MKMSYMERFLYYLAERKYRMYHDLYVFNSSACREDECLKRVKLLHKYEQLLEIIAMLPVEEQLALTEIEKEYFHDAPYIVE